MVCVDRRAWRALDCWPALLAARPGRFQPPACASVAPVLLATLLPANDSKPADPTLYLSHPSLRFPPATLLAVKLLRPVVMPRLPVSLHASLRSLRLSSPTASAAAHRLPSRRPYSSSPLEDEPESIESASEIESVEPAAPKEPFSAPFHLPHQVRLPCWTRAGQIES